MKLPPERPCSSSVRQMPAPTGTITKSGEIEEALDHEIRAELIRMVDPGDSKSLTKRLEYADICAQFGKMEAALETLSSLNKERPEDPAVAARLAFLLPPDQEDLALSLLTKAASTDEFVGIASAQADQLSNGEDATRSLGFYNTGRPLDGRNRTRDTL